MTNPSIVYDRRTLLSAGLALVLTAAFAVVFVQQAGVMPTVIIASAMLGGLVCWLLTTARYPAHPERVIPVYAITTALLMVHILEEYVWDFGPRIGALTGTGWSQSEFVVLFGFVVPAFWILAGALVYVRHPLGNWIIWFIWCGMILGEPVHLLVFPFLEGGRYHYFPGMWTALFPLVAGLWGMTLLITDYRRDRDDAGQRAVA